MNSDQNPVYTVGHSNHPIDVFIELLKRHGVDEVVDIRSSPYSRYASHFNYDSLAGSLAEAGGAGVGYLFMGGELGGRPVDQSCYDADGRVLYDRLADTDLFDDGIRRVLHRAGERQVALLCTENDPLVCHRGLLVAGELVQRGVDVEHILADGSLESHAAAMDRLLDTFKLPHHGDLFRSRDEVIADALDRQAKKVGYKGQEPPSDADWEAVH